MNSSIQGADTKSIIDKFFEAEKSVCKAFGYQHHWRTFPIVDHRNDYWYLDARRAIVRVHEDRSKVHNEGPGYFWLYRYPHLREHVYTKDGHTMILLHTGGDGNVYLAIFDDSKMANPGM